MQKFNLPISKTCTFANQIVQTKKLTDRAVSPLVKTVEEAGGEEWRSQGGSTKTRRELDRSKVAGGKEGDQGRK